MTHEKTKVTDTLIGGKEHWEKEKERKKQSRLHGLIYRPRFGGMLSILNEKIAENISRQQVGDGAGSDKEY